MRACRNNIGDCDVNEHVKTEESSFFGEMQSTSTDQNMILLSKLYCLGIDIV